MNSQKYASRCCDECGTAYKPHRVDALFCSTPCRKSFDNRAMVRGREMYSLFMCMRYERGLAKALGVWAIMCRMAMIWREEDNRDRDGRKSWQSPRRVIDRLPVVHQQSDVYRGQQKAGR